MTFTEAELDAITLAAPSIAADRIREAKIYDPADELKMELARYLYTKAGEWMDQDGNADPEAITRLAQSFIERRPKLSRKQRHRMEELAAERSHYPAAVKAALSLIRVEHNRAPAASTVFIHSVFQKPGLYSVHWKASNGERQKLTTLLPLSDSDYRTWQQWSITPKRTPTLPKRRR